MEPYGTLELFKRSLGFKLRYINFISDGDTKTYSLLQKRGTLRPRSSCRKIGLCGPCPEKVGDCTTKYKNTVQRAKTL